MQNSINPAHSFVLQQLLASQQAQRGLQNKPFSVSRPALFDQFALSSIPNRFQLAHGSGLGLTGTIKPFPSSGMFQAMMAMNNQSSQDSLDRERLFMAAVRQHEITARVMTERVAQQERLILNNKRTLEMLGQRCSLAPSAEPLTVQDAIVKEAIPAAKRQPTPTTKPPPSTITTTCIDDVESDKAIKPKEKRSKDQQPKTKQDTKWLQSYNELKEYKEDYGDCIVPRGFALNPKLASWVAEQRKQYKLLQDGKNSSITPKRVELLEKIGFAWNAQEAAWERHITDLKSFKEENGDCLVPLNHLKYPKLGLWVKEQRRHYALMKQSLPSHMTDERAAALNAVGFCWDTHEAVWGERFRDLCEYKAKFGNCIVPTNFSANPKLGTWVHHQRRQYKKFKEGRSCHITAERIRTLETIGFVWYPRKASRHADEKSSDSDTESESDDGDEENCHNLRKRRRLLEN